MNFKTLGIIFGITIVQFLLFGAIFMGTQSECGNRIVKCYDRNNNEIIGQTCQQNNTGCLDNLWITVIVAFAFIVFFVVNTLMFRSEL